MAPRFNGKIGYSYESGRLTAVGPITRQNEQDYVMVLRDETPFSINAPSWEEAQRRAIRSAEEGRLPLVHTGYQEERATDQFGSGTGQEQYGSGSGQSAIQEIREAFSRRKEDGQEPEDGRSDRRRSNSPWDYD